MQAADHDGGHDPLAAHHQLVGEVAQRVAHDLANRLAVARLTAEVLSRQPGLPPEAAEQVATLVESTAEAGALVQLLSALSGRRPGPAHEVDLGRLVGELAPLLHAVAGRRQLDLEVAPAVVEADRRDVEELLVRLVLGARRLGDDALSLAVAAEGATVVIESRRALADRLDPAAEARLHALADRCAGETAVRVEGATAVLTVRLPGRDATAAGSSVGGDGTAVVLVVEDDADLRDLVRGALEADGHDVDAVADVRAAVEHPAVVDGRLDLLVTDVELPGGSGLHLAGRLAAEGVRVLVISGRGEAALAGSLPPGAVVLPKPFGVVDLRASTRQALG